MSLAESFERRFLFGLGRHLWNIVGISGFISVLTGIILFGNSMTIETAKNKAQFNKSEKVLSNQIKSLKQDRDKELDAIKQKVSPIKISEIEKDLSLEGWSKNNGYLNPLENEGTQTIDEIKYTSIFDRSLTQNEKSILNKYLNFEKNYDQNKRLIYQEFNKTRGEFESKLKIKRQLLETKYKSYLSKLSNRNEIKRSHALISPLIMGYGLGVIASASITSAVLAVERNTRKD